MPRLPAVLCAIAAAVPLSARAQIACPAPGTGASGVQSLRLMTYNVFMTVVPADNSPAYGISQAQRATLIAARIIKDDPDIETHSVEVEGSDRKVLLLRPRR